MRLCIDKKGRLIYESSGMISVCWGVELDEGDNSLYFKLTLLDPKDI